MRVTLMQALVSLATNASFGFSYTNFAKLRMYLKSKVKIPCDKGQNFY